jgi:hypothetical protein
VKNNATPVRCMKDQRSLLDTDDIFGDNSIIATWKLDGDGLTLGNKYGSSVYGITYDEGHFDTSAVYVSDNLNLTVYMNFKDVVGDDTPFALSMWFYPTDIGVKHYLFGTKDSDDIRFYLALDENEKLIWRYGNKYHRSNILSISNNTWYHVVLDYDGTDVKIYLDGVEIDSYEYDGDGILPDVNYIQFGKFYTYTWRGRIDQTRLFNRALTIDEIQILFTEKKTK